MNVSNIEVDWREGVANDPELVLHIDEMKDYQQFTYTRKGSLYFGFDEESGQVSFFAYNKPSRGYGGHVFTIAMDDGSVEALIGPWSSRSSVMNMEGFPHSTECVYVLPNGCKMAGHILVDSAHALLKKFNLGIEILPTKRYGSEIVYKIVKTEDV